MGSALEQVAAVGTATRACPQVASWLVGGVASGGPHARGGARVCGLQSVGALRVWERCECGGAASVGAPGELWARGCGCGLVARGGVFQWGPMRAGVHARGLRVTVSPASCGSGVRAGERGWRGEWGARRLGMWGPGVRGGVARGGSTRAGQPNGEATVGRPPQTGPPTREPAGRASSSDRPREAGFTVG